MKTNRHRNKKIITLLLPALLAIGCYADIDRDNPNDPGASSYGKFYVWRTKTAMGTARSNLVSAVLNNNIYVIGGTNSSNNRVDIVQEYNPVLDMWNTKESMSMLQSTEYHSAITFNNNIYVIGGYDGLNRNFVQEFKSSLGGWFNKTNQDFTPRQSLAVAIVNSKIYAFGGIAGFGNVKNQVEEYDPINDLAWQSKTVMSSSKFYCTAIAINSKIYIIGGTTSGSSPLNVVEEFDPSGNSGNGSWSTKRSIPTARFKHTATVLNGKIYVIGGNNGSHAVSTVEVYNPNADTWSSIDDLPTPRYGATSITLNDKIYVIGGQNGSGYLDTVEAYEPYYSE